MARIKTKSKVSKKSGIESIVVVKQEMIDHMEVEAQNNQIVMELDDEPVGHGSESINDDAEDDKLSIQEFSDDQKSGGENSDTELENIPDSADLENEIRCITQHLFGKLESMIAYFCVLQAYIY